MTYGHARTCVPSTIHGQLWKLEDRQRESEREKRKKKEKDSLRRVERVRIDGVRLIATSIHIIIGRDMSYCGKNIGNLKWSFEET